MNKLFMTLGTLLALAGCSSHVGTVSSVQPQNTPVTETVAQATPVETKTIAPVQAAPEPAPEAAPTPPAVPEIVAGPFSNDNWTLDVSADWHGRIFSNGVMVAVNLDKLLKIVLAVQPTDKTVKDLVKLTASKMKSEGLKVSPTASVTVNGVQGYTFHVASKENDVSVYVEDFVVNSQGYVLMCGGGFDNKNNKTVCSQVLKQLTIKK